MQSSSVARLEKTVHTTMDKVLRGLSVAGEVGIELGRGLSVAGEVDRELGRGLSVTGEVDGGWRGGQVLQGR